MLVCLLGFFFSISMGCFFSGSEMLTASQQISRSDVQNFQVDVREFFFFQKKSLRSSIYAMWSCQCVLYNLYFSRDERLGSFSNYNHSVIPGKFETRFPVENEKKEKKENDNCISAIGVVLTSTVSIQRFASTKFGRNSLNVTRFHIDHL